MCVCRDAELERFCSAISPKLGALLQCTSHVCVFVCVCVLRACGAQVSFTQSLNHELEWLHSYQQAGSVIHTHMYSHATCNTVIHTYMPGQLCHFVFTFFCRPSPNSIHHHSTGFDRWSGVDLIIHVFL